MILTVGNSKGGTGKSAIASNIAVALAIGRGGRGRVLLIDCDDDQNTSHQFYKVRAAARQEAGLPMDFDCRVLGQNDIRQAVREANESHGDIIIDCGGYDGEVLRLAMTTSHAVLIPILPRSSSVWTFGKLAALVEQAQQANAHLKAYAVVNMADPEGEEVTDTRSLFAEDCPGIELLETQIGRRKAFSHAESEGKSVLELTGSKASQRAKLELWGVLQCFYDLPAVA